MNSITALMLSKAIEQDRRRETAHRPLRVTSAEPATPPAKERRSWSLFLRGLGLAGSKA